MADEMAEQSPEEIPVAWTAMPYRAPVIDKEGRRIGTAESLLGDESRDIFHGIVAKLEGGRQLREILAERVTRITSRAVYTDLEPEEAERLEPYQEEHSFHLGWGGLFRKHPQWEDEGPERRLGD
jgi:hypothetical protein